MTTAERFDPVEIDDGLWRWTAPHPEWRGGAAANSVDDWPPEVGSVLCRVGDAAVFIDAMAPAGGGFWDWADELVGRARRCLALTTIGFHRRSREQLVERYGASTSRARANLPAGIETVPLRGAGEVSIWIEPHRALVCGDRILGAPGGGLRLCPESWLGYLGNGLTSAGLRELMQPLLELPVERVLVSHGEPVLRDGHATLRRLL